MDAEGSLKWLCQNRFYLRDDYALGTRRDAGWSLFWIGNDGYKERIVVLAGTYDYACQKAYEEAKLFLKPSLES